MRLTSRRVRDVCGSDLQDRADLNDGVLDSGELEIAIGLQSVQRFKRPMEEIRRGGKRMMITEGTVGDGAGVGKWP